MTLDKVLPAFRAGAHIRLSAWPADCYLEYLPADRGGPVVLHSKLGANWVWNADTRIDQSRDVVISNDWEIA